MALPQGTTGSLGPTFVPARRVCLAVKLPYTLTLYARFPTVLREPLCASVTLWEATAPVKLPASRCPPPGSRAQVRRTNQQGWYFTNDSTKPSGLASQSPTYPTRIGPNANIKL